MTQKCVRVAMYGEKLAVYLLGFRNKLHGKELPYMLVNDKMDEDVYKSKVMIFTI